MSPNFASEFDNRYWQSSAIVGNHQTRRKAPEEPRRVDTRLAMESKPCSRKARQQMAKLTEPKEALYGCLDVLRLDDCLGKVMAATTQQLSASSSALFLRNEESTVLTLELLFQGDRILTPAEVNYPETLRSSGLDNRALDLARKRAVLVHLASDRMLIGEAQRSYLLGLGVKTLLIIPLVISDRLVGTLNFEFIEKRGFRPEEIEIARALAAQTSLAVQLTRLAKLARQSAVLEERNRLAGEIHDSLVQTFVAIAMQLNLVDEAISGPLGDSVRYLERAKELARFGLAEARRTAMCLRPSIWGEIGLTESLKMLVEHSNIPGRLPCSLSVNDSRADELPAETQQHLFRIAQEAISNAVRHANPTIISVSLRSEGGHLELQIRDDGCGISGGRQLSQDGFGLINMQDRAQKIGADLQIHGAPGHGTAVVVRLPSIATLRPKYEAENSNLDCRRSSDCTRRISAHAEAAG